MGMYCKEQYFALAAEAFFYAERVIREIKGCKKTRLLLQNNKANIHILSRLILTFFKKKPENP